MANPAIFKQLPGPKPLPVTGWRGNPLRFALDPLVEGRRLQKTYGDFMVMTSAGQYFILGFSPDYNRQLLSSPDLFYNAGRDDFPAKLPPNSAAYRLTEGLNMINGATHKRLRRLMQPLFQRSQVSAYRDIMVALTLKKLASWQVGQTRLILQEMRDLTLEIANATFLGVTQPDPTNALNRLIRDNPFNNPLTFLLPFKLPGLPYYQLLRLTEKAEAYLLEVIWQRRTAGDIGQRSDVVSRLIEARDEDSSGLSDNIIASQLQTLFGAGHETTASALSWTFLLLSQHPVTARNLYEELQGRLKGEPPTFEQLDELPLLEGVIKESLRLFPPFLFGLRKAQAPVEIAGYRLPAGTLFTYHPTVTHRRPELYPDPDRFRPERWEKFNPTPYEFMPFAGGPRMCLGAFFAMTEMKLVLATLWQKFRLEVKAGTKIDRQGFILSHPSGGLPLQLYRPDGQFSTSPNLGGNVRLAFEPA
jgi:cytochrome P450